MAYPMGEVKFEPLRVVFDRVRALASGLSAEGFGPQAGAPPRRRLFRRNGGRCGLDSPARSGCDVAARLARAMTQVNAGPAPNVLGA